LTVNKIRPGGINVQSFEFYLRECACLGGGGVVVDRVGPGSPPLPFRYDQPKNTATGIAGDIFADKLKGIEARARC
jgi:hypothetical protein